MFKLARWPVRGEFGLNKPQLFALPLSFEHVLRYCPSDDSPWRVFVRTVRTCDVRVYAAEPRARCPE